LLSFKQIREKAVTGIPFCTLYTLFHQVIVQIVGSDDFRGGT
jgi:hypothetical protein